MAEWKEITQLNVDTIKELNKRGHPIAIAYKIGDRYIRYSLKQRALQEHLEEWAQKGGIYYIVLPKLY